MLKILSMIKAKKMDRLLIISKAGDFKFVDRLIPYLARHYEILKLREISQRDLTKCKVAWFEWCDEALVKATRELKKTCRIIARLHRYEAFKETLLKKIDWEKVDDLMFVSEYIMQYVLKKYPQVKKANVHLVLNGVEMDRFTFKKRTMTKKIASVGYIEFRKNYPLLMQCFKKLYKIDKNYQLHLAGEVRKELEVSLYLNHIIKRWNMGKNVFFYGGVENINSWLEDKEYIVSPSITEGCPYNILEGMAKGIKPIIHCWPGAEEIFDKEFIFNTPEEFIEIAKGSYEPERYRKFVEKNFNMKDKVKEIFGVLNSYDK